MTSRKKGRVPQGKDRGGKASMDQTPARADATEDLSVGDWHDRREPRLRAFPGPRNADVPLRVAVDRAAHADLIAHAKQSLDAEVCGILAGNVCKDEDDVFVHVRAAIPGRHARQGGGHVTFTQETWEEIHRQIDGEHRGMQVVGWYHSHPGFGVDFSEMDLFIQRNFFPLPTQVALVVDPVSGQEAACINTTDGVQSLDRMWIDGREQRLQAGGASGADSRAKDVPDGDETVQRLRAVEGRIGQLIQAIDEQQTRTYHVILAVGVAIALAVVAWIGANIYLAFFAVKYQPPKLQTYMPVDVRMGDHTVRLGVGIVSWDVPPEIDPALQIEALKRALIESQKAKAEGKEKATEAGDKEGSPAGGNPPADEGNSR